MKKVIIGALVGLGITTVLIVKKINDDREVTEISNDDGIKVTIKETFKDALKKKINKILKWIGENSEKVESFTKAAAVVSTVIGIVSSSIGLYSSIKNMLKKPDDEMFNDIKEIKMRLVYLTPDLEITTF